MKGFSRKDPLFSLCGLNCGLCSMRLLGHCGGCGFGNQSCPLARCAMAHPGVEYCFQCSEYPCERYKNIADHDIFITRQHQLEDLAKAQRIGLEHYRAEQEKKAALLKRLLAEYNDGRRKTLFCLAVNLLELDELTAMIEEADAETETLPIKEKAAYLAALFQKCADQKGIVLKLRKADS